MSSLSRSKVVVISATLVFAVIASLSLSLGSSSASATGLTLPHFLIAIGSITVDLDDLYTPQAVLTGDHFFSEHVEALGGSFPINSLLFMVDLLTVDSHITILLIIVELPSGGTVILHGPYLLNLSGPLNYHINIAVNPLNTSQVLYVDASFLERLAVLNALHNGNVLAHFLLAH